MDGDTWNLYVSSIENKPNKPFVKHAKETSRVAWQPVWAGNEAGLVHEAHAVTTTPAKLDISDFMQVTKVKPTSQTPASSSPTHFPSAFPSSASPTRGVPSKGLVLLALCVARASAVCP